MRQFVELVPRDLDTLLEEARWVVDNYPNITGINIPDVLRLKNRSHDASKILLEAGIQALPHIRCIDRPQVETIDLVGELIELGLESVLIISGDPPDNPNILTYPVTPMQVVEQLKKRYPTLKVYCALDPYRQSFAKELDYCHYKMQAGADGFFTQPFFDADLARIYLDQLEDTEVFLGISPVLSEQSLGYWKTRNKAIFPKNFDLGIESHVALTKTLFSLLESRDQHCYMMPIRMPIRDYMTSVFT
ncbi:methylenetetrahydrofolate reductase [bacterium]|nr:methylenetetrahydrofolate reductase [bacterium]